MKNGMVILNYNDSENTTQIINEIQDFKIVDYIIIVDNKSTDDSVKKLKKLENKKIKVVVASENKGYAAGNNVGIEYLIHNYKVDNIIISNPDIVVKEEQIKTLIQDLKNKEISVIAPNIKEPKRITRGWKMPTFFSELVSNIPFLRRYEIKILGYSKKDYESTLTKVDIVEGCFFIIKKEVIEDIGYFDENTFLYYEETILAKKLKEKGYATYVDNRIMVVHALSQSVDKSVDKIRKFKIFKASQYYYEKEVNHMNSFCLFFLRVTYYLFLFGLHIEKWLKSGKKEK